MCALMRWPAESAESSESSPAITVAATTIASWRAFCPGCPSAAPATPRRPRHAFCAARCVPPPTVLKVRSDLQSGSDLSFLSVFPCEAECVYPPGTYLEPRSGYEEPVELPGGEELSMRVIEVVPRVSPQFEQ